MAMASALLATVEPLAPAPPLRDAHGGKRCAFSCLGCPSHDARRSHEELSLVEHVRLLLQAVMDMKRSLEDHHSLVKDFRKVEGPPSPPPLSPAQNPGAAAAAAGPGAAPSRPGSRSSEALGQRWPPSEEALAATPPAPPVVPAAPSSPPAALVAWEESPETPMPEAPAEGTVPAAPVAQEVSDTGQMDLLQLLSSQAHQEPALQVPANPEQSGADAATKAAEPPAPPEATSRGSVLTRTLQLPGLEVAPEAPAVPEPEAASDRPPGRAAAKPSIAAALWQTTPEHVATQRDKEDLPEPPVEVSAASRASAAAAAAVPAPKAEEDEAAFAMLNRATAQLQQNRLSHGEAAETFSELLRQLPLGRLRCSALLNRAHCYVGMGKLELALADIETITQGGPTSDGFDPKQWHKVWMSRGGIRRKLAQLQGSEELYAQSKADYEYVLSIRPLNESYATKARRCLQQLASRDTAERGRARHESEGRQASPSPKRRRMEASRSRSRSPAIAAMPPVLPAPPSAPSVPSAPSAPARRLPEALKALEAFGEDALFAGRRLFLEGHVLASRGLPLPADQRRYEVSVQGITEVVLLHATESSWSGSCTCRLSSHCKHVAAALCALEQEEKPELPAEALPSSAAPAQGAAGFRLEQLARQLERKTNDELKNYLRLNQQLLRGAKAELAQRLAENVIFGAVAPCPRCGGHLHPEEPSLVPNTAYFCKRQLREGTGCGYEVAGSAVERRPFLGAEELLKGIRG